MLKWLGKSIHQAWFVVAMCVGVIVGVVLGVVGIVSWSLLMLIGTIAILEEEGLEGLV